MVLPGSFLSSVVPEAIPASLPPGHALSTKAYMHPQDLALWRCSVRTRRIFFISPLGSLRMMLTYLSWGRYLPVMCHPVTESVYKNKPFLLSSCSFITASAPLRFCSFLRNSCPGVAAASRCEDGERKREVLRERHFLSENEGQTGKI